MRIYTDDYPDVAGLTAWKDRNSVHNIYDKAKKYVRVNVMSAKHVLYGNQPTFSCTYVIRTKTGMPLAEIVIKDVMKTCVEDVEYTLYPLARTAIFSGNYDDLKHINICRCYLYNTIYKQVKLIRHMESGKKCRSFSSRYVNKDKNTIKLIFKSYQPSTETLVKFGIGNTKVRFSKTKAVVENKGETLAPKRGLNLFPFTRPKLFAPTKKKCAKDDNAAVLQPSARIQDPDTVSEILDAAIASIEAGRPMLELPSVGKYAEADAARKAETKAATVVVNIDPDDDGLDAAILALENNDNVFSYSTASAMMHDGDVWENYINSDSEMKVCPLTDNGVKSAVVELPEEQTYDITIEDFDTRDFAKLQASPIQPTDNILLHSEHARLPSVGSNTTGAKIEKRMQRLRDKHNGAEIMDKYERKTTKDVAVIGSGTPDIGDTPCFHVVKSSTRSMIGYARIHVGGKIPHEFKGKYLKELPLNELVSELKAHARFLRSRGVNDILLSGTLWSSESRYQGRMLNTELPKCFDGMRVKFIASSLYADGLGRKVREYYCENEDAWTADTVPFLDDEEMLTHYVFNNSAVEAYTPKPSVDALHAVYAATFPNDMFVDTEQKMIDFHSKPFDEPMEEISLFAPHEEFTDPNAMEPNSYMKPMLHTHLDQKHPTNQQELTYSVHKRNYMPPKEDRMLCSIQEAWMLFESFTECWHTQPSSVLVTDKDYSKYIMRKGLDFAATLKQEMLDMPLDPERWFALVKGTPKPTLEDNNAAKVQPTQVIICKNKLYNAYFGPDCTQIKEQITKCLKPEYFIFSEHDTNEFERILTMRRERMKGNLIEIDMSKYDKSQGLTSLMFELFVMAYLGMSENKIAMWFDSHMVARVKSMTGSASFRLPPQRKSGDPWTYYGNTFYLIATLKQAVSFFGKYKINFFMASGDDSLIWGDFPKKHYQHVVDILHRLYNLEAKLIISDTLYFCSRFVILHDEKVWLVPDPVKMLVKYGKTDVRDRGHLEDVRISLLDHIDCYKYAEVRMYTACAVLSRYNVGMYDDAMDHMYAFAANSESFVSLFQDNANARKMAIIVPANIKLPNKLSSKTIEHSRLVRKNIKRMSPPEIETYMRAIGVNCGKRILITYNPRFVPQGFRILANLSSNYSNDLLRETVHTFFKN